MIAMLYRMTMALNNHYLAIIMLIKALLVYTKVLRKGMRFFNT